MILERRNTDLTGIPMPTIILIGTLIRMEEVRAKAPRDVIFPMIEEDQPGQEYSGKQPMRLPLQRKGEPLDFNFCDFDMVVVAKCLSKPLHELAGKSIQRISVELESSEKQYEILNVLDMVECVSEKNSEFIKWDKKDGRSDRIGQFRMINKLFIDQEKAKGHKIFRVQEWKIALIVDEEVKRLLESRAARGIIFQSVC